MASENVLELTVDNWESEVAKSEIPVMVDIWAPWCGPCRMLAPVVDRVADQFAGKVKVAKLNMDHNQQIAVKYGVSSIPVLLFFEPGTDENPKKLPGVHDDAAIAKELNRMLGT